MKIKVIGIGGIGCCLLPTLCRFLDFYENPGEEDKCVTLIDGDIYTEENESRQSFSRLGNKAEVTEDDLSEIFSSIIFNSVPHFVIEENIVGLIREHDIVFLCVDNHATRKLVSDRCEELNNVVLISGGNEFTDGNIQVHVRKDGEDLTLPVANSYHPEIEFPRDKNPGEASCDELVKSAPQLVFMNNMIAAMMLACFYNYLNDKTDYDEVYCDILTGNNRAVKRSKSFIKV